MTEVPQTCEPPLRQRLSVFRDSFAMPPTSCIYARRGCGPSQGSRHAIPQPTSCMLRRLTSFSYVWNRIQFEADRTTYWPVPSPQFVAVIELRGDTICFRMPQLLYFEPSIQLGTKVNLQLPWVSFESPFISYASGFGRIAFRIDGGADPISREPKGGMSMPRILVSRMVAWSSDTELQMEVPPGTFNAVTFSSVAARVVKSSIVLASRGDRAVDSDATLLGRVLRFVVP